MRNEDLDALAVLDAEIGVSVEHRWLCRPWGEQHVAITGRPDAPPIVLLHGWPQHWFAWRHALAGLSKVARVIAIDTRGFGWSKVKRNPSAEMGGLASDVIGALDDLGIERAIIAGHDWGGWVAFRVAIDSPLRVRALVGMAIVPPWIDHGAFKRVRKWWLYTYLLAYCGRLVVRWPRAMRLLIKLSTATWIWDRPSNQLAYRSYLERIKEPASATMTVDLYRRVPALLRGAMGPRSARLDMPATMLVGTKEVLTPPSLYDHRSANEKLPVSCVRGVKHWLLDEAPDEVVDHLRAIVTGR